MSSLLQRNKLMGEKKQKRLKIKPLSPLLRWKRKKKYLSYKKRSLVWHWTLLCWKSTVALLRTFNREANKHTWVYFVQFMKVYFVFIVFRFLGVGISPPASLLRKNYIFFMPRTSSFAWFITFCRLQHRRLNWNFFNMQRWFIAELSCIVFVSRVLCSKALYICCMWSSSSLAVLICSVPV